MDKEFTHERMVTIAHNGPKSTASKESMGGLSQEYGGVHSEEWVNRLPSFWIASVQLSRLTPPAASFLIFFSHFIGVVKAANTFSVPATGVARAYFLFFEGSFFCSNASHSWNDLVNALIDKIITGTKTYSIPCGAIAPLAAFIFVVSQAIGAISFLFFLRADMAKATIN